MQQNGQSKWVKARLFIFCLVVLVAAIALVRIYYSLTDDFREANIQYNYPMKFAEKWKTEDPSELELERLKGLLKQPYIYIGKGAQSYAFKSQDGQYVIKFFKFKHLKPSWWIDWLPSIPYIKEYREAVRNRKEKKLIGVFDAYHLAYQKDRDAAELIYLHLSPTTYLKQTVQLEDKLGLIHSIDLDQTVFLLQRKGEAFRSRLEHLINEENWIRAEESIAAILSMYVDEYEKGLYDRDHGVMQNTGFVGEKPFHLDVGKISEDPRIKNKEIYKKDLALVAWKIDYWIKQQYPRDISERFTKAILSMYSKLAGDTFDPDAITYQNFKKHRGFLESQRTMP